MSAILAPPSPSEIATLVQLFYRKVERDKALGPIFAPVLRDWSGHLETMTDFWTTALLGNEGLCSVQSVVMHAPHPIAPLQFVRWLALFRATAEDVFGPEQARVFLDKAERIAAGLQMGLFMSQQVPPRQAFPHGRFA
jgi:hemoglobin